MTSCSFLSSQTLFSLSLQQQQIKVTMSSTATTTSTTASWNDVVTREYEARVEPFTSQFVAAMMEPVLVEPSDDATQCDDNNIVVGNNKKKKKSLLDVGCGTGAVCLHVLNNKQSSSGDNAIFTSIVATDASNAMVERTRQRFQHAWSSDSNNNNDKEDNTDDDQQLFLHAVVADGQSLPQDWTNRFDVAVASFSVIFFPNPLQGLCEMYRCVKPKGRIVISAWGDMTETPAFAIFPEAIASVLGNDNNNNDGISKTRGKSRNRIDGSHATLHSLLTSSGFVDVNVVGPVERFLSVASPEAYYERFAFTSPPTVHLLAQLEPSQKMALRTKVMELAMERGGQADGSISIPAKAYFAYGTKP